MPSGQCLLEPIQVTTRIDNAVLIQTELVGRANCGHAIYNNGRG